MKQSDRPVRIALLGYGTVGHSLYNLLAEQKQAISQSTGYDITVCGVLVKDASYQRDGIDYDHVKVTDNLDEILDTNPDIVCEVMGGITPTKDYLLSILNRGIPVVTANKQLVAKNGVELFASAENSGTQLRFEASVCGAVPIIRMLRESLAATQITRILGILNGTTNYMLTEMEHTGSSYDTVLGEAQRLGYAEADPTDDVEGLDAAAKLVILAGIAFGTTINIESIKAEGIQGIRSSDVKHAKLLGCRIRLIASAERVDEHIQLSVTPMLIPFEHPLASVTGPTNAVLVDGNPFGRLVIQGAGAGGPETASAVAGDLISILGSEPSFLTTDPHVEHIPVSSTDNTFIRHYVRMQVADRPGVLASVANALASNDVSIERVLQERADNGEATLVLTTHPCPPVALKTALEQMPAQDQSIFPILHEGDKSDIH